MQERMIPDTHFITQIRNHGMKTHEALSEWIDNADDAGATEVVVQFYKDRVVVYDNGPGLKELTNLVKLAVNGPKTGIGLFGMGGKFSQLHFGEDVICESVCQGEYRRERLNWRRTEESGEWPYKWDVNNIKGLATAPSVLRNGGVRITVRELHGKSLYFDDVCRKLTYRYRLGLSDGFKIRIEDLRKKEPIIQELDPDLEGLGVYKNMKSATGNVAGMDFKVNYSDLKEFNRLMQGVHFAFGRRVINKAESLNGHALPTRLYAEVILSSEWKNCLNLTKDKIVAHYEELEIAVLKILKQWINLLEKHDEEIEIEELQVLMSEQFKNVLTFKPRKENKGDYIPGETITTTRGGGGGTVEPKPHIKNKEAIPTPGEGTGDAETHRRRPGGVSFKFEDTLGDRLIANVVFDPATNKLTIQINPNKSFVRDAIRKPCKMNVLWAIVSYQLANWIRGLAQDKKLMETAGWIIKVLEQYKPKPSNPNEEPVAFKPNPEEPNELFDQVNCFIMDQFAKKYAPDLMKDEPTENKQEATA